MARRGESRRLGVAFVASLALHLGAFTFAVLARGEEPEPPVQKVIRVDIVSPPPQRAGEPLPEAPADADAAPAEAASEPETPVPQPPVPEPPKPEPPKPEPPKPEPPRPEPPRPQPRREPERPPEPRKSAEAPRESRPAQPRPPEPKPPTPRPTAEASSRGEGTRTGPTTGRNPSPSSPGGEGVTIRSDGDPCPVAGYCENVTRQVQRFFRPPEGETRATGEVCFRILRSGRATDIEVRSVRGGGVSWRLAASEAAEQAGIRGAFGSLPGAFDPDRWRWCVELSPS